MKLTNQQEKVYRCILENRGITSKEIMLKTGIQCPSGRIAEMRADGVPIVSIGHKKYEGSKAFEMYAIDTPLTKTISKFEYDPLRGVMVERKEIINI